MDRAEMTDAPTTPSPERQPADASQLWRETSDASGRVFSAPQAQPDARAVEAPAYVGMSYETRGPAADAERRRMIEDRYPTASAPAADDGWRPISDYDGCGPVLVSTAPESPKYLFSEPVSAFHDAGGTWRCLGSKGGMAETALRPTHFRPLPAPPVALHPAAPADEVGK